MMSAAAPTSDPTGSSVVGRDAEIRAIVELLGAAREGRSRVLVLLGEPGIGKTTLLRVARGRAEGMAAVSTRGIEAESELSYVGLADVLRPLLVHLDALVPQQRVILEGLLAVGPPTPADPLGVSAAALSLFAAAAEHEPLLVLCDDFQWLDVPSQLALGYTARRLGVERIVMLFAAREPPRFLAQGGLPELRIEPLRPNDARALLRARAADAAPEVLGAIVETSGGNPLAIVELLSMLPDDQRKGRAPLQVPLPVNGPVEAAFTELVAGFDPEARRLLLVAAADDTSDPRVVVAASTDLGVGDAARRRAEESGALSLGRPVRFRHPVLRSVVYHLATESDRREAHRALAGAIDPVDAYRRAWHLAKATLDPDEDIASRLADAAADARLRQRFSSAAAADAEAARLTPEPETRARRLVLAASDYQLSGSFPASDRALDEALALTSDVDLRAEAHRIRGQGFLAQGRWADAVALLSREGEQLADDLPDAAALLLAQATLACQPLARIDDGLALGRRAVEIAERAGPAAQLAASLAYADLLALRGDAATVLELRERARSVASLDDPLVAGMVLQSEAAHLSVLGRHDEARAGVEQLVSGARAAGAAGVLVYPLGLLGEIELRSGNWPRAIAVASEAVEIAEQTGQLAWSTFALQVLTRVEAARGQFEVAEAHAATAQATVDHFAIEGMRFYLPTARAFLAVTSGDLEAAVDHGREVEEISRERGLLEPAVVLWAPDLIEAYARLGRSEDARRVLDRFAGEAEATQRTWALAAAARCRGLVDEDFEPAFADALEQHERIAMPFERARTELCLGERRRRAGRRTDARAPLRSAVRTFERLGAAPWVDRARAELSATGERVRPRDPSLVDQLTPHELRVAVVVARGATNREAAAELFLSPKTVDFHLRRVYRKLGIHSRAELGRLFPRDG